MTTFRKISLRNFYIATWWGLVCLTLINIFAAELAPAPLVLIAGVVCVPWLLPRLGKRTKEIARPISLVFLGAAVVSGIVQYRQSHDIIDLISGPMIGLLPIALWRKGEERGNWQALVLIFLISQVSLLVGQDATQFFIYMLVAILFVFNLNAAHLYFHLGSFESSRTSIPRNYLPTFLYSITLGMALALAFFFFFPRSIQWLNPLGLRQREGKITGYTGTVSLDGSTLTPSGEMVMQVESPDEDWLINASPFLFFRGNTVENFDGIQWKRMADPYLRYHDARPLNYSRWVEKEIHKLRIFRESTTNNRIFYPGLLRDFSGPPAILYQARYDKSANLYRSNPQPGRFFYEISISLLRPARDITHNPSLMTGGGTLPSLQLDDITPYLQIPNSVASQKYFQGWMSEVWNQKKSPSATEAIQALDRNFHMRFKATFDRQMPSQGALEFFLSRGREGYCEYFATAAALFLRAHGIPSRIVLGYRGGTFNPVSHVLEVRESNSHAWVEFYQQGLGWIDFDPTPLLVTPPPTDFAYFVGLYFSAARFWFERYIVQYNQDTQRQLFKNLTTFGKPGSTHFDWRRLPRWKVLWVVLAFAAVRMFQFAYRRRRKGKIKHHTLPDYYLLFEKRLKEKGYRRETGETFRAFHERVRKVWGGEVTDPVYLALERDLYSPRALSVADRNDVKSRVRTFP